MSGSVANPLCSQPLLKGLKDMEIADLDIGTLRRMVHNFPATAP
jgi:hypothetical protein